LAELLPQPELALPEVVAEESPRPASEILPAESLAEAEIAVPAIEPDLCATAEPMNGVDHTAADPADGQRRSFADRLRDWLGRAA
jgi:hypothetical protein